MGKRNAARSLLSTLPDLEEERTQPNKHDVDLTDPDLTPAQKSRMMKGRKAKKPGNPKSARKADKTSTEKQRLYADHYDASDLTSTVNTTC